MIEERRSIRKYKSQNINNEQIEKIVNAARLAPSAKNRQPWKYIVYRDISKNKLLDVMEEGLKKSRKNICYCQSLFLDCQMLLIHFVL